jgi:hypothetical protein
MNKENIAKLLSRMCYSVKKENSVEHAMQLFVEDLVLDSSITGYTQEDMKKFILDFLKLQ